MKVFMEATVGFITRPAGVPGVGASTSTRDPAGGEMDLFEWAAIEAFRRRNEQKHLLDILSKPDCLLTPSLKKLFIELVQGKKLRSNGRPKGSVQDETLKQMWIAYQVDSLISEEGLTAKKARERVADEFGRSERIVKAYHLRYSLQK